jgi:hypothetical protein
LRSKQQNSNSKAIESNSNLTFKWIDHERIADKADDPQKIRALTATAKDTIKERQKLIKLADKNKDGWVVVEECVSDDLASDTDDEK